MNKTIDDEMREGQARAKKAYEERQRIKKELVTMYDERLVREILKQLQGWVVMYRFDIEEAPLEKLISHPAYSRLGVRICSLTEGSGEHEAKMFSGEGKPLVVVSRHDVPEGHIYATIDTRILLEHILNVDWLRSKALRTYKFLKEEDGSLKYIDCCTEYDDFCVMMG